MEDDAIQNTIWKATQSHHNAIIPRHEWQPKNSKFTNNEQEPEENTTSTKNAKKKKKRKERERIVTFSQMLTARCQCVGTCRTQPKTLKKRKQKNNHSHATLSGGENQDAQQVDFSRGNGCPLSLLPRHRQTIETSSTKH